MTRRMLSGPAVIAALLVPVPHAGAQTVQPRPCQAVKLAGQYVTHSASSVQSSRFQGGTRAPSCKRARQIARGFLVNRRNAGSRGTCTQAMIHRETCWLRVRGAGTWQCDRTGSRLRVACDRGGAVIRFTVHSRSHL